MRVSTLKELVLYRYRLAIGYIVLIGFGVLLTTWQISNIPPGFNAAEIASAIAANGLNRDSASFIDAPYYLLQKASLTVLGPSAYGIRLPSVLLAMLLAAAAYVLLRQWFSQNTAIIGTILIITASHFLLRGRTGSPVILYSFWPLALLATAALANRHQTTQKFWFWLFSALAGLSLYTPYFGFILLIILLTIALSRQSKGIIEEVGQGTITVSAFTFLAIIAPLGYSLYLDPSQIMALIGVTSLTSAAEAQQRGLYLLQTLVSIDQNDSRILVPTLSLPAFLLAIYGLYTALRRFANLRYAIAVLLLAAAAVLYIATPEAPYALTFIPVMLLVIFGLHAFINKWYSLFPRNPYARLLALVPLAALLTVMVQFNYNRYFYGLARSESVRRTYDGDILLVKQRLDRQPLLQSGSLVVSPEQQPFYDLLRKQYPNLVVTTGAELADSRQARALIVASSQQTAVAGKLPAVTPQYVADDRPTDALRFRIYRN